LTILRIVGACTAIAACVAVVHFLGDPLRTPLPPSADETPVLAELRKLDPTDRALVEAYIARSRGDVLPARFADPDQPFTAHTFAEAIPLERAWRAQSAKAQAAEAKRQAMLTAALLPLREAVDARVVRAERVSPRQLAPPPDVHAAILQPLPSDEPTIFSVIVSVRNLSGKAIAGVQGALVARDRDNPLPTDLCWIDIRRRIDPAGEFELRCLQRHTRMNARQRAFIDGPNGRFTVAWKPRRIEFADGTRLESHSLE
jgi:hypothetical protein